MLRDFLYELYLSTVNNDTLLTFFLTVPKPILGLFYVAYLLTKATSISTKQKGTYTFTREDCVDHFIKFVEVINDKV